MRFKPFASSSLPFRYKFFVFLLFRFKFCHFSLVDVTQVVASYVFNFKNLLIFRWFCWENIVSRSLCKNYSCYSIFSIQPLCNGLLLLWFCCWWHPLGSWSSVVFIAYILLLASLLCVWSPRCFSVILRFASINFRFALDFDCSLPCKTSERTTFSLQAKWFSPPFRFKTQNTHPILYSNLQGADPPPFLSVAKAGRNHLNE